MSEQTIEAIEKNTETTEEIIEQPIEAKTKQSIDETKSKRSIRSEKQLEALQRAREKAYAKRREKAELKARVKAKQKQNDEILESEPEPAEPEPEELEPIEIIEQREERQQLKRTLTLTQDELHDMMSRVAIQTNLSKPKSKFKLVDGMYVLR